MNAWQQTLLLGAGFGAAFLLGQRLPVATPYSPAPTLAAQGRGPVNPAPAPEPKTPTGAKVPEPVVLTEEAGGAAVATNGFLAVTGSYGVGTSVLYLVDTVNRQLAVYEARGGSAEQRRIVLVGARKIDLDLQLEGYNDRSEYGYDRLKGLFDKRNATDPSAAKEEPAELPTRK